MLNALPVWGVLAGEWRIGAPLVALLMLIGLKAAYEVAQVRGVTAAMMMKLR